MQAQCATGYRGILCSECDVGYGWSDEATCVKCRSKVRGVAGLGQGAAG